jgi:hypothetical protein
MELKSLGANDIRLALFYRVQIHCSEPTLSYPNHNAIATMTSTATIFSHTSDTKSLATSMPAAKPDQ